MPRVLTSEMIRSLYAQETEEVMILLITIDHEDLPDAIRVSSDSVDTVSNGETYLSCPFEFILPDEPEGGRSPRARVRIANISPVEEDPEAETILDALRSVVSPPTFDMKIVRASAPDVTEAHWPGFKLYEVPYDSLYISGELALADVTQLAYPADNYLPIWFPGLF